MALFDWLLRWLHALAGAVTLAAMLIPLLSKKGGAVHRRAGWVFVGCMAWLCLSSAWLCVTALFGVPGESVTGRGNMEPAFGAFLLFVTLLTGNAVFSGLAVLRRKKRKTPGLRSPEGVFAGVLGLSSLALLAWGLTLDDPTFAGFSVLGILGAGRELRMLKSAPTDKRYWWYVHMNGMMGGCIGTLTAFLVINSENMVTAGSGPPAWVFWLAPSILGIPTLIIWRRYYRRKFGG